MFATSNIVYEAPVDEDNNLSTFKKICTIEAASAGSIKSLQIVVQDRKSKLIAVTSKG